MQNVPKDSKGDEGDKSNSTGSPKPLETLIPDTANHPQMCYCIELKGPAFTALDRPWQTIWQDGVHRCNGPAPLQVHPTNTRTTPGGHVQHAPSDNFHRPGARGNRKSKMSYGLESYLGQPVKEEAWNNVFGFYKRGGEDVGENAE